MERRVRRIHLPKRPTRKTTITLPVDLLEFLDECAAGVGIDRSNFLSLTLDSFYDEIASFVKGYASRIRDQAMEQIEGK